ncbi:MAG: AAA family ATPase [Pseudomonadales bacterium]
MVALVEEDQSGIVLCVTGAECTGKTTLAASLAEAFHAPLVSEVARVYLEGRSGYTSNDVIGIAKAQLEAEQRALADGARVVIADTDLTVIQVWWEEKYGELDPWLVEALQNRTPRRYLITRPDIPWEADPLRESPHDRERLHQRYLEILDAAPFPYFEVTGNGRERFTRAYYQVGRWMAG